MKKTEKVSRCCGRCDGVHDLCIGDTICEPHLVAGCTTCWPLYSEHLAHHTMTTNNNESPKREPGFYEVKRRIWQIGYYHSNGLWQLDGVNEPYFLDTDFDYIKENPLKIPVPITHTTNQTSEISKQELEKLAMLDFEWERNKNGEPKTLPPGQSTPHGFRKLLTGFEKGYKKAIEMHGTAEPSPMDEAEIAKFVVKYIIDNLPLYGKDEEGYWIAPDCTKPHDFLDINDYAKKVVSDFRSGR